MNKPKPVKPKRTKQWRVVYRYAHMQRPSRVAQGEEAVALREAHRIHNVGGQVDVLYVHPRTREERVVLSLPGLGPAPEGMRRCPVCGTADKVDVYMRFVNHQPGGHGEPCWHPESPAEFGPFVVALPDFRPGDKVITEDTDLADLDPEERDAAVGTVVAVEPARVRVSWPMDGCTWESPHSLVTVNVAYVHDGTRDEPTRVHIPEQTPAPPRPHDCVQPDDEDYGLPPIVDRPGMRADCTKCGKTWGVREEAGFVAWRPYQPPTLSPLALHRPADVPNAPGGYWGLAAGFSGPTSDAGNRMIVWNVQGYPVASFDGPSDRLGSTIADFLVERGYRITGLIPHRSAPGTPVFAVEKTGELHGVRVPLLTGPHHAPGRGVSSYARWVTVVDPSIPEDVRNWTAGADAPAVNLRRERATRFEPAAPVALGHIGYMASGAYVGGSGQWWRDLVGHDHPIPFHDRIETVAQYDAMWS